MCPLAAYVGDRPIAPLLLGALEHQEPYLGASATGMAALDKVGKILLEDHLESCLVEAVKSGEYEERLRDLKDALAKYL